MSNLFDFAPLLAQGSSIRRATVAGFTEEGRLRIDIGGNLPPLECDVLNPEGSGAIFSTGDEVLAWMGNSPPGEVGRGIILGHIGPHSGAAQPVVDAGAFAARPESLVIETQGDLVLRNGQARITLGAKGDVEIVCNSFATRSQRLLRLLAPMIKLN